ncbi:MAG: Asp-tRNA(Asn)/Glu-tRNA(Gln) amidotransferase subunit GatB, partial [Clostridiaceae bacterium]|nr:Asp-tRNA(Asn)/Glu-tRNA(Gln) amidotransferase subunit GatB [Clostridiaceae bacterium]
RSPEEAYIFLETLKSILLYIGVSDCKMEEGSLRCDINLSVRPVGQKEYGTRTEMKNVNSFSAALRAMQYERDRQIEVLEEGGVIEQETRRWDDERGESYAMRNKEDAQDYRYFPDPDLMPIVIDEEWVERIRQTLPELPHKKRERYKEEYGLPDYDAQFITNSKKLADFFEECISYGSDPKTVSNWIMGDISKMLNDLELSPEEIPFPAKYLSDMLALIESGKISNTIGKKILKFMFSENKSPDVIVKEHNLIQISDEGAILELVKDVLAKNEKSVNDYKSGKTNAFGFLVGQCMKASQGKANPQIINKLLKELLDK